MFSMFLTKQLAALVWLIFFLHLCVKYTMFVSIVDNVILCLCLTSFQLFGKHVKIQIYSDFFLYIPQHSDCTAPGVKYSIIQISHSHRLTLNHNSLWVTAVMLACLNTPCHRKVGKWFHNSTVGQKYESANILVCDSMGDTVKLWHTCDCHTCMVL